MAGCFTGHISVVFNGTHLEWRSDAARNKHYTCVGVRSGNNHFRHARIYACASHGQRLHHSHWILNHKEGFNDYSGTSRNNPWVCIDGRCHTALSRNVFPNSGRKTRSSGIVYWHGVVSRWSYSCYHRAYCFIAPQPNRFHDFLEPVLLFYIKSIH